ASSPAFPRGAAGGDLKSRDAVPAVGYRASAGRQAGGSTGPCRATGHPGSWSAGGGRPAVRGGPVGGVPVVGAQPGAARGGGAGMVPAQRAAAGYRPGSTRG